MAKNSEVYKPAPAPSASVAAPSQNAIPAPSDDENETVREVCAEMRECKAESYSAGGCSDCRGFDCRDVRAYADRIIAANEREMAAKDAAHQQWRENYHSQIAEKDAEIALLKAALKPVMECTIGYVHVPEMGLCKVDLYEAQRASFKAVQNAQGIMRHAEI